MGRAFWAEGPACTKSGGVSQTIPECPHLVGIGDIDVQERVMPGVSNEGLGAVLGPLGSYEKAVSKGGAGSALGSWREWAGWGDWRQGGQGGG